jgi:hypothetical protein
VRVALWSLGMAAVLALKVAELAAAATVTDAGTVSVELVLDSETEAPPEGAALVRETVQVLEAFGPRAAGAQASEETRIGATRDTLAEVDVPLNEAVRVAVWSEESVPAVAVKVEREEPNGMVTLAGTGRAGTLELNPTTTGPLVAAPLRLTVHVVTPAEDREAGIHARDVKLTGVATAMLPPVAERGTGYPARDEPKVPLTPMDIGLAFGASVTVTTATLPSGIVFMLSPLVRQMYALAPPAQLIVLPADVSIGPGATEKLVILAAG